MAAIRFPALLLLGVLIFATLATTTQAQLPLSGGATIPTKISLSLNIDLGDEVDVGLDPTVFAADVSVGEPASAPGPSPGRKLLQLPSFGLPPNPLLNVTVDGGEGVEINGPGPIDIGVGVSVGEPESAPAPSPGRKLLQFGLPVGVSVELGSGESVQIGGLGIGIGESIGEGAPAPSPAGK